MRGGGGGRLSGLGERTVVVNTYNVVVIWCRAPVPCRCLRLQIEAKKKERLTQKESQEVADCTFAPDLGLTRDVLENHNMGTGRCVQPAAL